MATSAKQVKANARNAQKSTGPKTTAGLTVVSQNAIKLGVYSNRHVVLEGEDQADYDTLIQQLETDLQVSTTAEKMLIQQMAQALWKKQRLTAYHNGVLQAQADKRDFELYQEAEKASQTEQMQAIIIELGLLKSHIEALEDCVKECQRLKTIKEPNQLQEEAENIHRYVHETMDEAYSELERFVSIDARIRFKKDEVQLTNEGNYYRRLLKDSVVYKSVLIDEMDQHTNRDWAQEIDCAIYSLKGLIKLLKSRQNDQQTQIDRFNEGWKVATSYELAGASLMLDETKQQQLQRNEVFLDNQFYRALAELQKLQVFLSAKKRHAPQGNGFVLENA